MHDGGPRALEERPAGPQHDRSRECKLQPDGPARRHQVVETKRLDVPSHLQRHDRQGQDQSNPEAAAHVEQLDIRSGLCRCVQRLQCHAADRAASWSLLPDLRVHGAGEDGALRYWRWGRLLFRQIALRCGDELLSAARAAEEVWLTAAFVAVPGGRLIDLHATDRIDRDILRIARLGHVVRLMGVAFVHRSAPKPTNGENA